MWICRNCGNEQYELPPQGLRIPPKVLYLDIELALMKVYIYDLYVPSKRIDKGMIERSKFVICWAAGWLDENNEIKKIYKGVLTEREAKTNNDKRIIKDIWKLLDEADVVVGHNSDSFDLRVLNWRFLKHGLGFPSEYKKMDTFKLSGRYTRPESRGLEYLSLELGGDAKKGLDRAEWIEIVEKGTPRLLKKADRYCRGDVREGVKVWSRYANAIQKSGKVLFR